MKIRPTFVSPVTEDRNQNLGDRMQWQGAFEEFRGWLVAAGRPATTIKLRMYQLGRFAADNPEPWAQTQKSLIAWLAMQEWAPETRRGYRSALRGFYGWAYASGYIDHDPAALLPPIKPGHYEPRPTPEQILTAALVRARPTVQLMIMLAAHQGLRRGEIARIHRRDLIEGRTGWSLRVHGKGNKERVVPLNNEIARRLRERGAGYAFVGQVDGHISARWVGDQVQRALASTGWTTHTLRHRFATVAYQGSRDLLAVQELLGHSRPETTRRYVQLPDDALRAAMFHAA